MDRAEGTEGTQGPLRVLAIDTHWSSAKGGISTFNRLLCIALAKAGARVQCLVLEANDQERVRAHANGVELIFPSVLPGFRPSRETLNARPDLPYGVTPDLIIGHGLVTGPAAALQRLNHFPGAAYLHIVHTDPDALGWQRDPEDNPDGRRGEQDSLDERHLLQDADLVASVGPVLRDRAWVDLSADRDPESVIQLDPGFDPPSPPRAEPPTTRIPRILVVGRLQQWRMKGLDIAARAVGEVIKNGYRVSVTLRGVDPLNHRNPREAFREWADAPWLLVNARSYSSDEVDISDDLSKAALVLMPSRAEGFGLVGLEAIVAGVPLLVSDCSGLAELLGDVAAEEAAGMVLPVFDDPERDTRIWADGITAILQNIEAAFDRAARLREHMRRERTWGIAAHTLLDALSALRPQSRQLPPQNLPHLPAFLLHLGGEDAQFARRIKSALQNGVPHVGVWDHRNHITSAADDPAAQVLDKAEVVLFVLSSLSERSGWHTDLLTKAMKRNKLMVVLQKGAGSNPPIPLPGSVTLSFAGDFRTALGRLSEHLASLAVAAVTDSASDIDADVRPVAAPHRPGFIPINEMPELTSTVLWDRGDALDRLRRALVRRDTRIIVLQGLDGMGKTALMRWLRDEQERGDAPFELNAFVYFSARGYRWITVPSLLEDLLQAAEKPTGELLDLVRRSPWRSAVGAVLEALDGQRVAVMIDDADSLFDGRGRWRDRELRALLENLAGREDHQVKVVLAISELPAADDEYPLRQDVQRIAIDKGLPRDEAEKLLRSLDAHDDAIGLRDATTSQLGRLWHLTKGHPRALHLVASLLVVPPEEDIDAVIVLLERWDGVSSSLFATVFDRLDFAARRVVQGLAIFTRPVPAHAVSHLLDQVAPSLNAQRVLSRLVRQHVVSTYADRYYLPPENADFVLSTLLTEDLLGQPDALTKQDLWRRAATYFLSERLKSPERVDDLWPQFGEIEVSLRARQLEHALAVMTDIDDRHLSLWGQSHVLASWREDLKDVLVTPHLAGMNLSYLVDARRQHEGAARDLDDITAALDHARALADWVNELTVSLQLADAWVDRGRIAEAAQLYEAQVEAAHGLGRIADEIHARGGLATCLAKQGRFGPAEEQQLRLFDLIDHMSTVGLREELRATHLLNRAWIAEQRGNHEGARRDLQEGLALAKRTGRQLLEGWIVGSLANNALLTKRAEDAITLTKRAALIGIRVTNHRLLREVNVTQALAHLSRDCLDEAAVAADAATRYATRPSGVGAWGVRALVAIRDDDDKTAFFACSEALELLRTLRASATARDDDYQLLDAEGIMLAGLVLLGRRSVDEAVEVFLRARDIAAEPGVLEYVDLVLRQFGDRAMRSTYFGEIRSAALTARTAQPGSDSV